MEFFHSMSIHSVSMLQVNDQKEIFFNLKWLIFICHVKPMSVIIRYVATKSRRVPLLFVMVSLRMVIQL